MSRLIKMLTLTSAIAFVFNGIGYADLYMEQVRNVQTKCQNDFGVMNKNANSGEQKIIVDTAMKTYREKEAQLLKDAAQLGKSGKLNESEKIPFKQKVAQMMEFCKLEKNKVFYARKKPIGMKWD
ncbi:MAG: hypothetical protein Q8S31_08860 [Alphaproteobacteria bacterium]|nr:hypothetical protein [Alphaproteobacteria bacterium]